MTDTTKTCNICCLLLDKDLFSKSKNTCKKCRSIQESERRSQNIEKYRQKDKEYYSSNKETIKEKNKIYNSNNQESIKENKKVYYMNNKEKIKNYHDDNKEKRNARLKEKRKTDASFSIHSSLRARVHELLKKSKDTSVSNLIGCNKEHLLRWLSYQFYDDISLENYGKLWHIDHVIPVSFFNITDKQEQLICFHWSNLRPLKATENLKKSNHILSKEIINQSSILERFTNSYEGYQTNTQTCWWQRVKLWYGNNPKDEENFESFLKLAIRNEAPKGSENLPTGNAQRLNGSGSV